MTQQRVTSQQDINVINLVFGEKKREWWIGMILSITGLQWGVQDHYVMHSMQQGEERGGH